MIKQRAIDERTVESRENINLVVKKEVNMGEKEEGLSDRDECL